MKDLKKYVKPALITLGVVGCGVGAAVLLKKHDVLDRTSNVFKAICWNPLEYKPFADISKEETVELLKQAINGAVNIVDAQGPVDGNQFIIFLENL